MALSRCYLQDLLRWLEKADAINSAEGGYNYAYWWWSTYGCSFKLGDISFEVKFEDGGTEINDLAISEVDDALDKRLTNCAESIDSKIAELRDNLQRLEDARALITDLYIA